MAGDVDFITNAPEDVRFLLAERERLLARIDRLLNPPLVDY